MSVAFYIVAESDIEGFDTFVDGKALAHADEQKLSALSKQLKVKDLTEFLGFDAEELADFVDEADFPAPDDAWFDPAEGLVSVRALRDHLRDNRDALADVDAVIEDLEAIESVLVRLEQEGVRWHFAVDF